MTPKSIQAMKVSEVTRCSITISLSDQTKRSAIMKTQLYSVCLCLLLFSILCPRTFCKRGALFRGKGKEDGSKEPLQWQSKGLTKQGLRVVGAAAAAGILGGTGTGYGLGFLGKGKNKSGQKTVSRNQHMYHREGQTAEDQSQWNAASPAINNSVFLLSLVPFLIIWIRDP
ncbi:shadow of prion protein 2 [Periophthalmus magnuspinnatus]|uniref:shadow of prion protein 2 n=1 Tax=Periophthalmus magnuspinnatus TaxID=409849 RepID=UPI0024369FC3|nr:shadow of prion protein 2 [Periophthalmus magnuspinnatus]